jgi:hypothetical protein
LAAACASVSWAHLGRVCEVSAFTEGVERVLIRRHGESWRSPETTTYPTEAELQRLLAESPELLPGDLGVLATARELRLATGSLDIVAVGAGGELLLCECKLERNEQARRAVIGQILSYAASLAQLSFEQFDAAFARSAGMAVATAIADLGVPDWDEEAFRQGLADSLGSGKFTLVVAVDGITDELKRMDPLPQRAHERRIPCPGAGARLPARRRCGDRRARGVRRGQPATAGRFKAALVPG